MDHCTRDSLTDKIRNLKREMDCLRATDIQILHQLVALYQGLEAAHWLLEERGTLVSRGSSLAGSQSSLTEGPEPGPGMSLSSLTEGPEPGPGMSPSSLTEGPGPGMSPNSEDLSLGPSDWQRPLNEVNAKEPEQEEVEELPASNSVWGHGYSDVLTKATGRTLTLEEGIDGSIVGLEEQSMPSCTGLFGYDARWCWVESQDDVTFL
ncbi:hypothetical protein DPEC_G00066760 [Dallia pectoralis]|uniref:Uncharacterized protein n=1 Tax=Dallia pectoralis TaxID=75939 RepID=A0ACC2H8A0_DALPE|nr:hypothetical protein DPEC_G00066760 [Dallia pectoralis]